jgi:putative hydrolase of the HAD superfamily
MPRIEAVLFDAAGTLLHVTPSVGHVYAREAAACGVHCDPDALDAAFGAVWRARREAARHGDPVPWSDPVERAWWRDIVVDVFTRAGRIDAFDGQFDRYFEEVYELFATPPVWRLFDDVLPCLDALDEAGLRCAVLSNWDSRLPRLVARMGLDPRFEFVLTSAESGWRKPHPGAFQAALGKLGVPVDRVLHVGDSHRDDVTGALAAGITPVWVDRKGRGHPDAPPHTVESLAAVPELVGASH